MQAQPTNDSRLHPVNRVKEDVHEEDVNDVVNDCHSFGLLGEQIGNLSLKSAQNDQNDDCQDDVVQDCQTGILFGLIDFHLAKENTSKS